MNSTVIVIGWIVAVAIGAGLSGLTIAFSGDAPKNAAVIENMMMPLWIVCIVVALIVGASSLYGGMTTRRIAVAFASALLQPLATVVILWTAILLLRK